MTTPSPDSFNPYASPAASTIDEPAATTEDKAAEWRPRQFGIEEVFTKSWAIFKEQWLMACAAVLIVGAINFGIQLAQNIATQIVVAVAGEAIAVLVVVQIVLGIILAILQMWIQIGLVMVMFDVARGQQVNFGKLFDGGRYLLATILANLMLLLAYFGIVLLVTGIPCAIVAAISQDQEVTMLTFFVCLGFSVLIISVFALMISQFQYLIIDREMSAPDALSTSITIMRGNKLRLLLVGILFALIAIGAVIVGLLALCVGIIPAMICHFKRMELCWASSFI